MVAPKRKPFWPVWVSHTVAEHSLRNQRMRAPFPPVMLTNTDGNAVWEATFAPFGETVSVNEDPDGDGTAVTMNIRLPGQYFDAETGLNYNWHRYYDPAVGRYVQAENLSTPESIAQPFEYVNNNPISGADRSGSDQDENCTTIWTESDPTNEWFPGKSFDGCSPSCKSWTVQTCEGWPPDIIGRSTRTWPFGRCIVQLNADVWYGRLSYPPEAGPANDGTRFCVFEHEKCHLRPGGDAGRECNPYRTQARCEEQTNGGRGGDYFTNAADRICDGEANPPSGCGF